VKSILVFDIGGTHFRSAVAQAERLIEVHKMPSQSFVRFPHKSGEELVSELITSVCSTIEEAKLRHSSLSAVMIAVPGMVTEGGVVVAAPPLWGDLASNVPLQAHIQRKTDLTVFVFNDLCGTALYYSEAPDFTSGAEYLTLITLSTGIGSKTVDLKQRRLLIDSAGRCGEIGHVVVDFTNDALPCDCGRVGHLSSYLSGRGIVRLLRFMADKYSNDRARSMLDTTLEGEALVFNFAQAVRAGDLLGTRVLDFAAAKLARVIQTISGTIGVDRYVLVGGLAFALGDDLLHAVNRHLAEIGMFGWDHDSLQRLVKMGIPNDDVGLLGAAKYGFLYGRTEDISRKL